MANIVVAVSPFYKGTGWTDKYTGIHFKPNASYYPIHITEDSDLRGIQRSLQLNTLYLISGDVEPSGEVSVERLDPSELSEEQLKELVQNSGGSEELQEQLSNANKEIGTLKEDKKALETQKTNLTTQVETLTGEKTTLQGEKSALDTENKQLKEDKKALEGQVSKKEAYIVKLQQELTDNSIEIPTEDA